MRITSIETRVLGYDIAEAFGDVGPPEGITTTFYRTTLDTIRTDVGIEGHTMQNANIGDGAAMGHVLHQVYAPHLLGRDPMEIEAIWHTLRRLNRHAYNLSDGVAGTIDVALWDIRGKAMGQPVASILGRARSSIGVYATARTIDPAPDQVYEEAKLRRSEGYHGFKIQFWDGLERDIPRFRAAREAVGDDFPLMQDAAGMYSFTEALAAGRVLDELGYTWFEEPIPDRNTLQLRRLCEDLRVPILAGETLRLHELPEQIRQGAFDIARGDVHLKEGITGLRKAVFLAELFGFDLEIHGIGQPILDIANLHVALSITNCRWVEAFHPLYAKGVKEGSLAMDATGHRHLPPGPGLGVEIDWDWVDGATLEVIRTPSS